MYCSFDVGHAKNYGVDVAIIIELMQQHSWDRECLEGKWTVKLILKFLPFLHSEKRVRNILEKAIKHGVVLKFNEGGFSRVQLYCLDPVWACENFA